MLYNDSEPKDEKYILSRGIKSIENLGELFQNIADRNFSNIIWSDLLYEKSQEALKDPHNTSFFNSAENNRENNNNELSLFKKIKALIEGDFPPEITTILILAEQEDDARDIIIAENFEFGSCCFLLNEMYPKGVSLLVLGYSSYVEDVNQINEEDMNTDNNYNQYNNNNNFDNINENDENNYNLNPDNNSMIENNQIENNEEIINENNVNNNEIDIDDPIFNCIDYKERIVCGDFKVDNGVMIATFILDDDSERIEKIKIPE